MLKADLWSFPFHISLTKAMMDRQNEEFLRYNYSYSNSLCPGYSKTPIFYKAFQQSESLRTQISSVDCRQCPSQGIRAAAALQVTQEGVERRLANIFLENTNSIRKVKSHSFPVPAVSRLLPFALYTVHCAI